MQRIVALIPARGGSRGIPRKNTHLLNGCPLVAHTILHAKQAHCVNRIVVSTEDAEIAEVSKQCGAEVLGQPVELSSDSVSSEAVLAYALDYLQQMESYNPDLVVFLQATSPLRLPEDIDGAVAALTQNNADSCFSVTVEHFLPRWQLTPDQTIFPANFDPRHRPRRQERPIEYVENGSIYVFRPWVLRQTGCRMGGNMVVFKMPLMRSFQVDTWDDLTLIEPLHALIHKQQEIRSRPKTQANE